MPKFRKIFFGLMLARVFWPRSIRPSSPRPLPTIGRYFSDFENLPWVVTAYLLTSTASRDPSTAKLQRHPWPPAAMMLTAIGIFIVGSVMSAGRTQHGVAHSRSRAARSGRRRNPSHRARPLLRTSCCRANAAAIRPYMGVVWVTSGGRRARSWAACCPSISIGPLIFWLKHSARTGSLRFLTQTYLRRIAAPRPQARTRYPRARR